VGGGGEGGWWKEGSGAEELGRYKRDAHLVVASVSTPVLPLLARSIPCR
jgi:hypothetical protein